MSHKIFTVLSIWIALIAQRWSDCHLYHSTSFKMISLPSNVRLAAWTNLSRSSNLERFLYSWENLLRNICVLLWSSTLKPFRFVSSELDLTHARSQSAVWRACGCQPTLITDQQWVTSSAPNSTDNCSYYYTSPSCTDMERQPNCIRGQTHNLNHSR